MTPDQRQRVDIALLSFAAGFVDTCVFVGLFGLFTAHVTGNLAMLGMAVVQREGDLVSKLLSFPVFILAIAMTVQGAWWMRRAGWRPLTPLLCIEAALLVASAVAAFSGALPSAGAPLSLLVGSLATAAMGLQNALMRIELTTMPSTAVMTTNVTQLIVDTVTVLAHHVATPDDRQRLGESRRRARRTWPAVLAFTLGAAGGAFGYLHLGFAALALPAAVCLVLAWRMRRA